MNIKIGINGFGRIGRLATRLALKQGFEIVGVNDIAPVSTLAHLFEFDSVHRRYQGTVSTKENSIVVDGKEIPIFCEKEPAKLPWKQTGAEIVFECTGRFTDRDGAAMHLQAGAQRVIISAPGKKSDATFVFGVNHKVFDPSKHHIVSNASCTTNCLAPVVAVLHKEFGVVKGLMTTIHSYTNDQEILDAPHKDLRRARGGAMNQIPTSTGAAKAVGLVLPELEGKLDGLAIRVPTANVSLVDLVCELKKSITTEELLAALKKAAAGEMKGVLGVEERELVSSDFIGDVRSSIVDAPFTKSMGNMVKVLSWYDNEIGFSCRMLDLARYIHDQIH